MALSSHQDLDQRWKQSESYKKKQTHFLSNLLLTTVLYHRNRDLNKTSITLTNKSTVYIAMEWKGHFCLLRYSRILGSWESAFLISRTLSHYIQTVWHVVSLTFTSLVCRLSITLIPPQTSYEGYDKLIHKAQIILAIIFIRLKVFPIS